MCWVILLRLWNTIEGFRVLSFNGINSVYIWYFSCFLCITLQVSDCQLITNDFFDLFKAISRKALSHSTKSPQYKAISLKTFPFKLVAAHCRIVKHFGLSAAHKTACSEERQYFVTFHKPNHSIVCVGEGRARPLFKLPMSFSGEEAIFNKPLHFTLKELSFTCHFDSE